MIFNLPWDADISFFTWREIEENENIRLFPTFKDYLALFGIMSNFTDT